MPYRFEDELVQDFVVYLSKSRDAQAEWDPTHVSREFDYSRGRTDVVALSAEGEVLAFEAKLKRWRDALDQAHRNRCFAHRTYVVVPDAVGERALANETEFRRRNVGLCLVSSACEVLVAIEPDTGEPWQPWLSDVAAAEAGKGERCNKRRTRTSRRSRA